MHVGPVPSRALRSLAFVVTFFVGATALAHGSHGGRGGGSGHGASANVNRTFGGVVVVGRSTIGGQSAESSFGLHGDGAVGFTGFGRIGGEYGTYLYVGDESVWATEARWRKGYWARTADEGWSWYAGPWWASPAYPGWVWIGPPWVWDGERMIAQDGYWTTVNMPEGAPPPAFGDPARE